MADVRDMPTLIRAALVACSIRDAFTRSLTAMGASDGCSSLSSCVPKGAHNEPMLYLSLYFKTQRRQY